MNDDVSGSSVVSMLTRLKNYSLIFACMHLCISVLEILFLKYYWFDGVIDVSLLNSSTEPYYVGNSIMSRSPDNPGVFKPPSLITVSRFSDAFFIYFTKFSGTRIIYLML